MFYFGNGNVVWAIECLSICIVDNSTCCVVIDVEQGDPRRLIQVALHGEGDFIGALLDGAIGYRN